MSIRKFFGTLVPGFALALLVVIHYDDWIGMFIQTHWILTDRYIFYVAIILTSYLLGLLNIQIAFRFLDIVGGWGDRLMSRVKGGRARNAIKFCSERLHIFNLRTLGEEAKANFSDDARLGEKDEYAGPFWSAKMLVLTSSTALAKEAMEIEGEINFYAGMFLPLVILGVAYRPIWPIGALALLVALFFAVRFQHLRHDDIAFIASAAESIRRGKQSIAA